MVCGGESDAFRRRGPGLGRRGGSGLCLVEDGAVARRAEWGATRSCSPGSARSWRATCSGDRRAADRSQPDRAAAGGAGDQPLLRRLPRVGALGEPGLPSFREGVRGEWLAAALGLDVDPVFPPGCRCGGRSRCTRTRRSWPCSGSRRRSSTRRSRDGPWPRARSGARASCSATSSRSRSRPAARRDGLSTLGGADRDVRDPVTGAELARAEDEIDAYVCAYTALFYWTHGDGRCRHRRRCRGGLHRHPGHARARRCLDRVAADTQERRQSYRPVIPTRSNSLRHERGAAPEKRLSPPRSREQVRPSEAARVANDRAADCLNVDSRPGVCAGRWVGPRFTSAKRRPVCSASAALLRQLRTSS